MKTLTLAHYYCTPEVQALADRVGDSLDLAMFAAEQKAERIVFAGVRFMAETVKILVPNAEVILPHKDSTCSLVTQTDMENLKGWDEAIRINNNQHDWVHVMYINSSAAMKAEADIIVTSRIVDDVVRKVHAEGSRVMFSPDRNMGAWLDKEMDRQILYYSSVCEVHDQFAAEQLDEIDRGWTDGNKYLLAHPESPLPVLERADYIGSTHGMLGWVRDYPNRVGTIFVATEEGLLYNMRQLRPELDIRQAPIYSGCQCNSCPYMKLNTPKLVRRAQKGKGEVIDYMTEEEMEAARRPIERMLEFQRTGEITL